MARQGPLTKTQEKTPLRTDPRRDGFDALIEANRSYFWSAKVSTKPAPNRIAEKGGR